jgi:phenylacetate-CoA ligase
MSTESGKIAAPYDVSHLRMSPDELRGARTAAAAAVLATLNEASSFYGTCPGFPFRSWDAVPVLSGTALAAEITAHPPFGRLQVHPDRLLRAGQATASVPHPVPMCWSASDLELDAQLGARALWRAGLRPRGRTSDCLDGGLVTPGTLAITDALDAIDALALPVGPITSDAALTRARDVWSIVQPQLLITTLDTFTFLATQRTLTERTDVVLLTPSDATALSAAACAGVHRVLSLPIVGTFIAGECNAHAGLHLAEDAYLAEVVDDSGRVLPDGDPGRFILSTLRRSHAIVRLDTGLRASIDRSPCGCGETYPRVRIV